MVYPVTAQDEILRRIQALDREEGDLRRQATALLGQAARREAEAEAKAVLRRQYEYAFQQLGGELAAPVVPVPGKKSGHLVASLG